jgi:predicted lipoprotein with Yx(FWY)xxD motif
MRLIMKLIPAVAVSSLLAACGSSSSSSSSPSASASSSSSPSTSASQPSSSVGTAVVKTASVSSLGTSVLVDAQGVTLYHLSGEQNGKWICTSAACVKVWHPLAAPTGGAPSGSVGSLGTVKRPGGAMQVTFKGMPLYTFAGDTQPGEAKGQGVKDVGVWTAVTASGSAASTPAPASTTPASSGGGGYGY